LSETPIQDSLDVTRFKDVCAAVATPPGQSGLAVVRLSGTNSAMAASRLFRPAGQRFPRVEDMPGYTCAVGDVIDPSDGSCVDQVVLTRFTAPHSFTGEDVIEISCHGSTAVKRRILDILFRLGVQPAGPGEFSRRAFLNGKIDLAQAEAVMDLIQADAQRSARAAADQMHGRLSVQVRVQADGLYQLLAQIELILEYPEHEDSNQAIQHLRSQLSATASRLNGWISSYRQGRILREGLTVVIAGRPNAGKSSLLNALAGQDRAIVTPIPGTTRDTIEIRIDLDGLPVNLIDTAGLHESIDPIEHLGIARSHAAMQQADLVFWLLSPPVDNLDDELAAIRAVVGPPVIILAGKEDLGQSSDLLGILRSIFPDRGIFSCSAVSGEGLDKIRQVVRDFYQQNGSTNDDGLIITSSRHLACLEQAASQVGEAEHVLAAGLTLDIAASLVRGSLDALAELTGDQVSDELIQTIFSRFCVGK
jgi:tRNA modification GTPase